MWVKANLNFDQYRAGKVYEVDDTQGNLALLGAGYFALSMGDIGFHGVTAQWAVEVSKEATDGPDQAGQGEEDPGGTGSGSASGDPYSAADSDGGQEAGAQG